MNEETNQQEESNEVRFNVSCDSENRISVQVEGITKSVIAVLLNVAMKNEDVKKILLTTATIINEHSDELEQIENLK
jgi:hypothetical protein